MKHKLLSKHTTLALIAALSTNSVIGDKGSIPWHIADDLKRFKRLTIGNTVIMGRKTFESIGAPLPNRVNIVVSRDPDLRIEGCTVVSSLDKALEFGNLQISCKIFIIGGAQLYKEALPYVDVAYLTHVTGEYEGDTLFPTKEFHDQQFIKTTCNLKKLDDLQYTYSIYCRRELVRDETIWVI